jgi:hypothetical protein
MLERNVRLKSKIDSASVPHCQQEAARKADWCLHWWFGLERASQLGKQEQMKGGNEKQPEYGRRGSKRLEDGVLHQCGAGCG